MFSCSKKVDDSSTLKETNLETQMIEVYKQGMQEFEKGDVLYAGKKFSEAELLFPQSSVIFSAILKSQYWLIISSRSLIFKFNLLAILRNPFLVVWLIIDGGAAPPEV